jgi:hypothetical protein
MASVQAPTITNFTAVPSYNNYWTFSGTLLDGNPAGATIYFGGLSSLSGKTTTVNSYGTFSLSVQLQPGESGYATAQAKDLAGQWSAVAEVLVEQLGPVNPASRGAAGGGM